MDASSLGVSGLQLQSPTEAYTLSDSTVLQTDDDVLFVALSVHDFNQIAARRSLAVVGETLSLHAIEGFAADMAGNLVVENTLQVSSFFPDVISPRLSSFDVDMTSLEVMLSFDETVDVSTIDIASIGFVSYAHNTTHSLLESSAFEVVDPAVAKISIHVNDANALKVKEICLAAWDCAIFFQAAAFADPDHN
jgi:hypothetical protein